MWTIQSIWEATKKILWNIIKIPFEFWQDLPWFVHAMAWLILLAIGVFIIALLIRYRNDWKYVRY